MPRRQAHRLRLTFIARHRANYRGRLFNGLSRTSLAYRPRLSGLVRYRLELLQDDLLRNFLTHKWVDGKQQLSLWRPIRGRGDARKRPLPYPRPDSDVKLFADWFFSFPVVFFFLFLSYGRKADCYFPRGVRFMTRFPFYVPT